ncbi:MAG TPA: vitamin B12-dependent ribonucleotide reductase [Acidimicrobiales bacterium]|nr:vitamin B12-dependent ribonucleotide reductase [Acidimicrobiales bacterium]
MAIAPERTGIGIRRYFTTAGTDPYDSVTWERRDARITNYATGAVAFEQLGVEVPSGWSVNATNILAQKYFRGTLGMAEREWSLKQVADRVVDTITAWGLKDGYFVDKAEADTFQAELKWLVIHQRAAFNSPVWFNIGVQGVPQQASACFILSVDDSMDSILNWYVEEGKIFKGGSGAGINLSRIRSSKEGLRGGGTASGPVSFMRGADASAGTIKSGGKTRRAAKMVILNADHPDIEDFIWCKAIEEKKARALRDAGFDMDLDGKDSHSIQYQNANNSVRVTDEFMQAVLDDKDWELRAVSSGEVLKTMKARALFRQIAEAAWECADPGMQFDSTINRWHTASNTGRINGSNPCSEYVHLDNSACNLASLNLLTFLDQDDLFDVEGFKAAVECVFTAQEILVGNADYPTKPIGDTSRRFRELGLGYANLGALLMAQGLPYDSDAGRAWAGAITALMTGHAYAVSARTAARMGPFAGYHENREPMLNVLRMHRAEVAKIDEDLVPTELLCAAQEAWDTAVETAETYGVRNSQATVLAPTGCLVGGTLVPTERGLVRLGSLGDPEGAKWQDLGIKVATDEGPQLAEKFYVNGSEPVVSLATERGYRLRGTPQHRIKVVDAASGDWDWKPLADLAEGDIVPLALGQLLGEPRSVPLPPLPEAYWTGEHHAVAPRTVTPELAELVGYFMGDGSLHSRGLRFCVGEADFDVVERLRQLGKAVFGLEAATAAKRGYTEVRLDSVRVVLWWEACGFAKFAKVEGDGGKGYTAHIPNAVLAANDPEVYGAFLRGLYEADGDAGSGYPTFKTTSIELAHDVQTLLLALGYPATLRVAERASGWGDLPLASVRLLNFGWNEQWLEEVGFMGGRKNGNVAVSNLQQAGRGDYIPLTRELIDRLAPVNDRLRKVLLMQHSQHKASRRAARELYELTNDARLGHLLSYFYDRVSSVDLGDDELTYDLSVPANVTYVANGFVSHNTIGLMMDCDTTGIEPDLGLVKTKKLVGGGTMSIVNQTVPRALRRLGYPEGQVDEIAAYIDEHKSVLGAPHLSPDHLAVFACSMGDNTIHYLGHVRMMAAAQAFLSGAVSKTVNMPEDVSVEDVEQLHIDAWKMGVKAVAIYRDNCKVAQPLATTKSASASAAGAAGAAGAGAAGGRRSEPGSGPEAHDAELAQKVAELEKALQLQTVVVKKPIHEHMPRKRKSSTFSFRVADCEGYVTVGEFPDGRPGEVFISVSKQGSTLAGIMDAFAISVSMGLQHGVPLATFVRHFTNMRFEPAGMTDDPDLRFASSLVDYIFRRLAVEYMGSEERADLGIQTVSERMQPTLPGVEEAVIVDQPFRPDLDIEDGGLTEPRSGRPDAGAGGVTPQLFSPAGSGAADRGTGAAKASSAAKVPSAATSDAPYCYQCGVQMQRAGSCFACPSCGTTSGCS